MNACRQNSGRPVWVRLVTVLGLVATTAVWAERTYAQAPKSDTQPPKADTQPPKADAQPPKATPPKPGVSVNDPKAYKGYTLVAPMNSKTTFLIDMDGHVVKTWESEFTPGLSAYLLENGHLLRAGNLGNQGKHQGAGQGGRVQEFDWEGNLIWDYTHSNKTQQQHHDIHRMPNGNVLLVCWDKKTKDEAIAAGRRTDTLKDGHLMADCILEVKPTGKTTGEVVWEWHVWDHLVQDNDKTKANYGNVSQKAERIDINFGSGMLANLMTKKDDLQKLRDIGYVGGQPPAKDGKDAKDGKGPDGKTIDKKGPDLKGPGAPTADWTHFNGVSYNADLDQIVISVHAFSEIWIIDHSTTTAEAASHRGGRYGKGGDLLYRWGNPKAYRSGTNADQRLFNQHNAHWIPRGLPGAGNMLIFNNGRQRPDGTYSSVDEIVLPGGADGKYTRKAGLPFGPDKPVWSYTAQKKTDFYASFISGAHRLPNGNTLVCSGPDAKVFEVTPDRQTVWMFVNPRGSPPSVPAGTGVSGPPAPPGQLMTGGVQDQLKLTDEQKKQVAEIQKEIDEKLAKVLNDSQQKQLKEMREAVARAAGQGGDGFGGLFRSYRYSADYPGLAGRELKPGKKIEEFVQRKN